MTRTRWSTSLPTDLHGNDVQLRYTPIRNDTCNLMFGCAPWRQRRSGTYADRIELQDIDARSAADFVV